MLKRPILPLKDTLAFLGLRIKEDKENGLKDLVFQFFQNNPEPNDDLLHKFTDENKVSPHELETAIYKVLSDFITGKAFKHGEDPDKDFDKEQLDVGIKVEKEHTDNELIAKAIAKSHLAENKSYYKLLQSAGL
jgi:hypothetical protein